MLTGIVDTLENLQVKGWAFNTDAPGEHLVIRINQGTRIIATGIANLRRQDLPDADMGAGDHGFGIDVPGDVSSLEGLMVIAQSQTHGEIALAVVTPDRQQAAATRDASLSGRLERAVSTLNQEVDEIRQRLGNPHLLEPTDQPDALLQRLARLEDRMQAMEVFFARVDGMMHALIEGENKSRKRFLGIF